MNLETQEAIKSIYLRVAKQRASANKDRDKAMIEQNHLMLSVKVKAYTDILCLLKGRYGSKLTLPES